MESSTDIMRVERSGGFDLPAPTEIVFPLFGPGRESDWAWGWHPEPVQPDHIAAEEGAVFKTNHDGSEAIWLLNRYDPGAGRIEYITFRNEDRLGIISIHVSSAPEGSHVEVIYSFTALSEKGRASIAHFTGEHYRHMMHDWQHAISHYLATGETLKMQH